MIRDIMTQCRTHHVAGLGLIGSVLSLATTHAMAVVRIAATVASANTLGADDKPGSAAAGRRSPRALMVGLLRRVHPKGSAVPPPPAARPDGPSRGIAPVTDPVAQKPFGRRIDLASLTASDLPPREAFATHKPGAALKRLVDVLLAVAMLALALPLMALTALAIRIDSPGAILYRQQRVGQFGRPFTLLKFRSMISAAETDGIPRWAMKQDPRITRVGRFIRATRIDELPQLVNVIRGDMSLVGPRPERPHFVEQLAQVIPFYLHRSDVKPGLTGWAQINFPYGASVEDAREKLAYDLYYVKNQSFLLDMRILFSTIRVVAFCQGAH